MDRSGGWGRTARAAALGALALAAAGFVLMAAASTGYRLNGWSVGAAFGILRASSYAAAGAVVLAVVGLLAALVSRRWGALGGSALAIVIAGGAAAVPLAMQRTAQSVPRIHDITTDTEHPPEFVALRALREGTPNGAAYGGPAVAAAQRQAYPDVGPLLLSVPPNRAFGLAEATARHLGWQIVAAAPDQGRIEATATTRWFRFKDDVVVRVAPALDGSRIDVRSVSRIGRSDLGANARRIRSFLADLAARARNPTAAVTG